MAMGRTMKQGAALLRHWHLKDSYDKGQVASTANGSAVSYPIAYHHMPVAHSPLGRSHSNGAGTVRHRHAAVDDRAPPQGDSGVWSSIKRGGRNISTSTKRRSNLVSHKLLQLRTWVDETKQMVQLEFQKGQFTRETILRVASLCIVGFTVLRFLIHLLRDSVALSSVDEVRILIPTRFSSATATGATRPWIDTLPFLLRSIRPRHNNINFVPLSADAFDIGRRIRNRDLDLYHSEKKAILDGWDEQNEYHDAREKHLGRYVHYEEDDYPKSHGCYRPKWSYAYNPTCNNFHEFHIGRTPTREGLEFHAEYISHGFFRETFLLQREGDRDSVLKVLRLHKKKNVNAFVMEQVQIEAVVMGETSGSGLTFDIYGHCGTSVTVERGYLIRDSIFEEVLVPQKELNREQVKDIKPRNDLTNEQRLLVALAMAESLAVLHGHKKGVIANDDVQIEQWLLDSNGRLKLNDMNNAVIVKWSPERNEYCDFRRSFNYIYRSPDENNYAWTNEASDIYALGVIYYTLMTGLVPFYQYEDWDLALEALRRGDKPYVDPRYTNHSIIEAGLVRIMRPCWAFKPSDRPSIFTIVKQLRNLVAHYEKHNPGIKIRDVDLKNIGYM